MIWQHPQYKPISIAEILHPDLVAALGGRRPLKPDQETEFMKSLVSHCRLFKAAFLDKEAEYVISPIVRMCQGALCSVGRPTVPDAVVSLRVAHYSQWSSLIITVILMMVLRWPVFIDG